MTREELIELAEQLDSIEPRDMNEAVILDRTAEFIRSTADHPPRLRIVGQGD